MRALLIAVAALGLAGCTEFAGEDEGDSEGEDSEEEAALIVTPPEPRSVA